MWGGGDGGRRNGIAIGVAVAAVVLVAMVAAGGRVPLATEGEGGWDLFIPNLQPQTPETVPTTRPTVVGPPNERPRDRCVRPAVPSRRDHDGHRACSSSAAGRWRAAGGATSASRRRRSPTACRTPVPTELVDALDEGIGAMAAGPVDDVIVECWVRLEEAAAGAGVERLPSETPSELAARVLADLHGPSRGDRGPPRALPHGPLLAPPPRRARPARGDGRAAGDPRGDRRGAGMIDRRTVVIAVLVGGVVRAARDVRRRGRRLVA